MPPSVLIILGAAAFVVWSLWRFRANLHSAVSASLLRIVDAVVVGYVVYLCIAIVFDFGAFKTWAGAARIVGFYGKPSGGQYFAIALGLVAAYLRFFQSEERSFSNKEEYQGGRRILCHKVALQISNAILAARADKENLPRPQHLHRTNPYSPPNQNGGLEVIERIPDLETNLALTPYLSEPEPKEFETMHWGMLRIPKKETERPFLVVGASGSGKTVTIHALMKSVLPRIKQDRSFRAFIYDDKPDFLPFAEYLQLSKYVWNFDPFSDEGVAWDIAADVTSYAEAMQIASVLAPVDPGLHEPYFQQAVYGLLCAVLISFLETCGKDWTLRDVKLAFNTRKRLEKIVARHPESLRRAQKFVHADKSLAEVLASVEAKLGPYDVAAALWSHAGKNKRSVREWSKTNAILMVTGRSIFSAATKPINQALFRMVNLLLLSKDDSDKEESWVFLDEIREIGKLEDLHTLANKGRSKGVRMVLGFQSISGMRAEYKDENAADEIANACGHKTFLNLTCEKTREWAAKHVGTIVVNETVFNFSESHGPGGSSSGVSWQTKREVRQAMEASDFEENLRPAMPEYGVTALNIVPHIGTYVSWVPWAWIDKNVPKTGEPNEELRGPDKQKLLDWDLEDLKRLNLPISFLACGFTSEDIQDLPKLAGRLHNPEENDGVSQYLREKLSEAARSALNKFVSPETAGAQRPEVESALLHRLNDALAEDSLFVALRFKEVWLRPDTKSLIARSPKGLDLAWLNRMLLEDAYPEELARVNTFAGGGSGVSAMRHSL